MKFVPIINILIYSIIDFLKEQIPKDKIILTPISANFPKCSNFAAGTKFQIKTKSFPNSISAETKDIKISSKNGKNFDTICYVPENETEPEILCELTKNVSEINENSLLSLNLTEEIKFNDSKIIIKNYSLENFGTFNSKANFDIIDLAQNFKIIVSEKNESIIFNFNNNLNELNVNFKIENFSKNLECEINSKNNSQVICYISNKIKEFTKNYQTYKILYQNPCGNWINLQTTLYARLKTNVNITITNVTFHDYYCSRFTESTHFELITNTNNIQTFTSGYNNEFYLTDKNNSVKIEVECFIGNEEINAKIYCKTNENVPQGINSPLKLAKNEKEIKMKSYINDECYNVILPFELNIETKGYDPNQLTLKKNDNENNIKLNDYKVHYFILEFYEKVLKIPDVNAFNLNNISDIQKINCEKSSLHKNIIVCNINKHNFNNTKEEKIYGINYNEGCNNEVLVPNINIYLN